MYTGAEALVTSCPWCEANFMAAIKTQRRNIRLYSLVDLVCRALSEDVIK